jgi:hypothetical protein
MIRILFGTVVMLLWTATSFVGYFTVAYHSRARPRLLGAAFAVLLVVWMVGGVLLLRPLLDSVFTAEHSTLPLRIAAGVSEILIGWLGAPFLVILALKRFWPRFWAQAYGNILAARQGGRSTKA